MSVPPTDIPDALPEPVQALFWEYDVDALSWKADRDLIIHRVLTEGDWEAVTWLRARLGDEALRVWIVEREGGALSPRQLRFWQLVLNLPAARVDAWIKTRQSSVWEERAAP